MYKIGGYRLQVVRRNLKQSFPQKTARELKQIEIEFYKQLFDLLVESIKGFSMSKNALLKRVKLVNSSTYNSMIEQGQSCLLVGGHYANWEWAALAAPYFNKSEVAILYAPIKNQYINNFIKKHRSKHKASLVSGLEAPKMFRKFKNQTTSFILIADQSPSNPKRAHWIRFLNQDTAVLRGPAAYAQQNSLPFMYVHIMRIKRGYYEVEVRPLSMDPCTEKPEQLSARYMHQLEQYILENPAQWLWSHRRWKHSRTNNN